MTLYHLPVEKKGRHTILPTNMAPLKCSVASEVLELLI